MTWLVRSPWLIALLSAVTMFWETFYCFLVWPRLTRPIALGMAVLIHGGIALFMGMVTFGVAMIFANLAFVPPETTKSAVQWLLGKRGSLPRESDSQHEPPRDRKRRRRAEALSARPRNPK
jgi:hypothetical protein